NSSHFGQFLPTGLSQATNSQSGYLSHPTKTRFFFDLLSTISPCLHVGHVTPIFVIIGFVLRHSGKLVQARILRKRPILITIGLPHFSQSIPAGSSFISMDSISFSAFSRRGLKS